MFPLILLTTALLISASCGANNNTESDMDTLQAVIIPTHEVIVTHTPDTYEPQGEVNYLDEEEPIANFEVVEEFLSEFLTLFSPYCGWRNSNTGEFHARDRETLQWTTETDNAPMVYIGGSGRELLFRGNFYDRDGN